MSQKINKKKIEEKKGEAVFTKLETTTYKTEAFFEKNAKVIGGIFGAVLLAALGYFAYLKMYVEPRNESALSDLAKVQNDINAGDYEKALKGQTGSYNGLDKIISEYGGTDAGNVAKYYAAVSNYQKGDYKKALDLLDEFSTSEEILSAMKIGMQGDCYSQLKNYDKALELYEKASQENENELTTPLYLKKQGILALTLGKKDKALAAFTKIKEKYEQTIYGQEIDKYIARSK